VQHSRCFPIGGLELFGIFRRIERNQRHRYYAGGLFLFEVLHKAAQRFVLGGRGSAHRAVQVQVFRHAGNGHNQAGVAFRQRLDSFADFGNSIFAQLQALSEMEHSLAASRTVGIGSGPVENAHVAVQQKEQDREGDFFQHETALPARRVETLAQVVQRVAGLGVKMFDLHLGHGGVRHSGSRRSGTVVPIGALVSAR